MIGQAAPAPLAAWSGAPLAAAAAACPVHHTSIRTTGEWPARQRPAAQARHARRALVWPVAGAADRRLANLRRRGSHTRSCWPLAIARLAALSPPGATAAAAVRPRRRAALTAGRELHRGAHVGRLSTRWQTGLVQKQGRHASQKAHAPTGTSCRGTKASSRPVHSAGRTCRCRHRWPGPPWPAPG